MRQSLLAPLLFAFSSLSHATFTFPIEGTSWAVGEENTVKWDMAEMQAPISLYLADADAVDIKGAEAVESGLPNTGSWSWTPKDSQERKSCSLLAVDVKGKIAHSKKFKLIHGKKKGHGKLHKSTTAVQEIDSSTLVSTATHTVVIETSVVHTVTSIFETQTVVTETAVETTLVYTLISTATHTVVLETSVVHTVTSILETQSVVTETPVETTAVQTLTSVSVIQTTTPFVDDSTTTLATSSLIATTPAAANGTVVAPTATAGSPPIGFTGAAVRLAAGKAQSLFAGGLAGFFLMGFM